MASIEFLILFLVVASFLSYFITKLNAFAGSVVAIFATMFVMVSLAAYGFSATLVTDVLYLPGFTFEFTYLGAYFAIIVAFVYSMVSFFHPYFVGHYKYKNAYNMLFLLSLAGVLGAFFTNNFLQLFFFFELIVWTTMFLIPLGKSKSAAVSYFGFSTAGSFAMLFGILVMFKEVGSFDITAGLVSLSGTNAIIVFVSFIIAGFAKLGVFPLSIWLPIAHGNAPHPFSPVLSGALVKLGAFVAILALVRISPASSLITAINLPFAHYIIALLGAVSIVFGTLMAIREDDAKKLLAYSSMSHGGYIIVAFSLLDTVAFAGGFYHILAHALASAGAFMAIAAVAHRTGTTKMSELGGIIQKMPITYIVYLVAIISMAGIPPMGGFISKWLIFQAVIDKGLIFIAIAVFFGSIGSFLYVFRPLAALFLGQELPQFKHIKEAPIIMLIPMVIITLLNIYTGVLPNQLLGFINKIMPELGAYGPLVIDSPALTITGNNGVLHPALIAGMFGVGVVVAAIIFFLLKKSRQVGLMDTYTAANFIHTEELLHYSVDFYAPLERLYEKHTSIMTNFYAALANKVKEIGKLAKYLFMSKYVEVAVFWIVAILAFLLWGEL
ncbi:MAG: NADH-quinone oxidoreductase subunit M [Tenericutes bacterium HGW-Tenericutes-3]|nr:MAG: NADH-quinone oxidoreductase subunit M [Tenericutes bacterium HGW-Tenericutes-3]